jgi:predicted nucleic acid-binding protein
MTTSFGRANTNRRIPVKVSRACVKVAVDAVFALREELLAQVNVKAMEQPDVYGDSEACTDWVDNTLLDLAVQAYAAHVVAEAHESTVVYEGGDNS